MQEARLKQCDDRVHTRQLERAVKVLEVGVNRCGQVWACVYRYEHRL